MDNYKVDFVVDGGCDTEGFSVKFEKNEDHLVCLQTKLQEHNLKWAVSVCRKRKEDANDGTFKQVLATTVTTTKEEAIPVSTSLKTLSVHELGDFAFPDIPITNPSELRGDKICTICLRSETELQSDILSHSEKCLDFIESCGICSHPLGNYRIAIMHYMKVHKNFLDVCLMNDMAEKVKDLREFKTQQQSEKQNHLCLICLRIPTPEEQSTHSRLCHFYSSKCGICRKSMGSYCAAFHHRLEKHRYLNEKHFCPLCVRKPIFPSQKSKNVHLHTKHGVKVEVCYTCGFPCATALEKKATCESSHSLTDASEKKSLCSFMVLSLPRLPM